MSNENLSLGRAFEALGKGIRILLVGPLESDFSLDLLLPSSSDAVSDYISTHGFEAASVNFLCSKVYASVILMFTSYNLCVDAGWLKQHVEWLNIVVDLPKKLCQNVYDDPEASEFDSELAYQLNETFVSAVIRISEVLDKIRFNEIKVKWKNDIEPSPWPIIQLPERIDRVTEQIKDYNSAFREIINIAMEADKLLMNTYSYIIDGDFKPDDSDPAYPKLSEDNFQEFVSQIDLCKKKAEVFSLKLKNYKTRPKQPNNDLPDNIGNYIPCDYYSCELESFSNYSKKIIPGIYAEVPQMPNVTEAISIRFKASCLSCIEIYKCVNKFIELYNSEHGDTPLVSIPITIN
jgi:hypothetical protein